MGLIRRLFGLKASIVVVDDSDELASMLVMFLRRRGYRLERASDGLEGVELVRRVRPDLVLLDITMPKLDGMGALIQIKSDPKTAHIPVLMCTDHSMIHDVEKCFGHGAVGYILKPFELDKVLEKVRSVLKERP